MKRFFFVEKWTPNMYLFHAAIDQFVRSAKEQVLCRFTFRSDKLLKSGPIQKLPMRSVLHYSRPPYHFQLVLSIVGIELLNV